MAKLSTYLFFAAFAGIVACSEKEQSATATTAPLPGTAPAPATGNTAQAAAEPLNPAHGQPNHRCDIPVGVPLSMPAQPRLTVPQNFTPPPSEASKAVAASGINPPHGQPGHDCSVAVGAPLSK